MYKTLTCQTCGKEFVQKTPWHRFCTECAKARANELRRQRYYTNYERYRESKLQHEFDKIKRAVWFNREWAEWKRDFAAGRTQSNLKASA